MPKIRFTLKDPDGISHGITEHVIANLPSGLTPAEREMVKDSREETARNSIFKWVQFDEYVTIEIDTDTGEATVIPVR